MRFTTIWDFSFSMKFSERIRRTRDWATQEIARRLPLRLRYWTTMQMMGRATMDSPNVPATPLSDILTNLDAPKVVR